MCRAVNSLRVSRVARGSPGRWPLPPALLSIWKHQLSRPGSGRAGMRTRPPDRTGAATSQPEGRALGCSASPEVPAHLERVTVLPCCAPAPPLPEGKAGSRRVSVVWLAGLRVTRTQSSHSRSPLVSRP